MHSVLLPSPSKDAFQNKPSCVTDFQFNVMSTSPQQKSKDELDPSNGFMNTICFSDDNNSSNFSPLKLTNGMEFFLDRHEGIFECMICHVFISTNNNPRFLLREHLTMKHSISLDNDESCDEAAFNYDRRKHSPYLSPNSENDDFFTFSETAKMLNSPKIHEPSINLSSISDAQEVEMQLPNCLNFEIDDEPAKKRIKLSPVHESKPGIFNLTKKIPSSSEYCQVLSDNENNVIKALNPNEYQCRVCGFKETNSRETTAKTKILDHISSVHLTTSFTYHCRNCQYSCLTQQDWDFHEKTYNHFCDNIFLRSEQIPKNLENEWFPPLIIPSSPTIAPGTEISIAASIQDQKKPKNYIYSCEENKKNEKSVKHSPLPIEVCRGKEKLNLSKESLDCSLLNKTFDNDTPEKKIFTKLKVFMCKKCNYTTKSRGSFWHHKKFHTKFSNDISRSKNDIKSKDNCSVFQCKECDFSTFYSKAFKRHYHHHKNLSEHKCYLCTFSAKQSNLLQSHLLNHHKSCSKKSTVESNKNFIHLSIQEIRQKYLVPLENGQACKHCGAIFHSKNNLSSLREHVYSKHLNIKPYICNICGYSSSYLANLNRHKRHCEKFVTNAGGMKSSIHQNIEENGNKIIGKTKKNKKMKKYRITKMGTKSEQNQSLQPTLAENKSSPQIAVDSDEDDVPLNQIKLKQQKYCPDKSSINESQLNNSDEYEKFWGINGFYECTECKYKTKLLQEFKRHRKLHTTKSRHDCELCSYSAIFPNLVRLHKLNHHEKHFDQEESVIDKPITLSCQICKFKAKSPSELDVHDRFHSQTSSYKCSICNYSAEKYFMTLEHEENHHTKNEKNTVIIKKNSIKKNLKQSQKQMKLHEQLCILDKRQQELQRSQTTDLCKSESKSPIKLHKCIECEFSSVIEQELRRHKIHHGKNPLGSEFKCRICSFSCDTKNLIELHCIHHHHPGNRYFYSIRDMGKQQEPKEGFSDKTKLERNLFHNGEKLNQNMDVPLKVKQEFVCLYCDFSCNENINFDQHMKNHFVAKANNNCPIRSFSAEDSTIMFDKFHDDKNGNLELSKAKTKYDQMKNKSIKNEKKEGLAKIKVYKYKCQYCNFSTQKSLRYNNHIAMHRNKPGEFKHQCKFCSYSSNINYLILRHMTNYHDYKINDSKRKKQQIKYPPKLRVQKGFKWLCSECRFSSPFKAYIKNHQSRHTLISAYKCCLCSYSAPKKKTIDAHQRCHHDQSLFKNMEGPKILEYKLSQVKIKNPIKNDLTGGILIASPPKVNFQSLYKRKKSVFSCVKCDYITKNLQAQRKHNLCHIRKNVLDCNICDYSCKMLNTLNFHLKHHHKHPEILKKGGKFLCNKCDFSAPRKYNLIQHLKRHGSNLKYLCCYCDYSSKQNSFVISHQETSHKSKKILRKSSEYEFNSESNTTGNDKLSGIYDSLPLANNFPSASIGNISLPKNKRYNCKECLFSTDYKTNFFKHVKNHNKSSINTPGYHCTFCSYYVRKPHNLIDHLKSHHNLSDYDISNQDIKPDTTFLPLTPDSSEMSGSEASILLLQDMRPLISKSNEEQAALQKQKVLSWNEKSFNIQDSNGLVLHNIPSTFNFPSQEQHQEITEAKRIVEDLLKKSGDYLPSKSLSKAMLCRFCPFLCYSNSEKTSHEKNHGVTSGTARQEKQYQCPLCTFSSDNSIDGHLGVHLRLAEFHQYLGNKVESFDIHSDKSWPVNSKDLELVFIDEDNVVEFENNPSALQIPSGCSESFCQFCGICLKEDEMILHQLRHQLGSHFRFL